MSQNNYYIVFLVSLLTFLWNVFGTDKSEVSLNPKDKEEIVSLLKQESPERLLPQESPERLLPQESPERLLPQESPERLLPREPPKISPYSATQMTLGRGSTYSAFRMELKNNTDVTVTFDRLDLNPSTISYASTSGLNQVSGKSVRGKSNYRRIILDVDVRELQVAHSDWYYIDVEVPPHNSRIVDVVVRFTDAKRIRVLPQVDGTIIFRGEQGEAGADVLFLGVEDDLPPFESRVG